MYMKQQDQLLGVFSFLSKPYEFAKQAQIQFKTLAGTEQSPFRFYALLNRLLILNLLTTSQRIICLFLLLASPPEESEFIGTMIWILEKGVHAYESLMIYDFWVKNNKRKYEIMKINEMVEDHETGVVTIKETVKNQILILIQKLQKIVNETFPEGAKSQIIPEVCEYEKSQPPSVPLNQQQFNKFDFLIDAFDVNFQRPIPEFIPIGEDELVWMNPGIISDIKYDCGGQFIDLYRIGQSASFSKTQRSQFQQMLPSQISLILTNSEYFIDSFTYFFSFNPHMAFLILQQIHDEKVVEYFYDKLINVEVNKSTLQIMRRLIFQQEVPKMTINYYIIKTMQKCEEAEESQQEGLVRMILALVREIIKANKIDLKEIEQEIRSFGIKFSHIEEVAKFYKIVVQASK